MQKMLLGKSECHLKLKQMNFCEDFSKHNEVQRIIFSREGGKAKLRRDRVQVSLVIRGRYVLSIWTANPEFTDKKSIFD